jgi:hypothetical protein
VQKAEPDEGDFFEPEPYEGEPEPKPVKGRRKHKNRTGTKARQPEDDLMTVYHVASRRFAHVQNFRRLSHGL